MKGTCSELVINGEDATRACSGSIMNTIYRTGRTGFIFMGADQVLVTFSGQDSPAVADKAVVRLDLVFLKPKGGPEDVVQSLPATGTCVYANHFPEGIHVDCSATTASGRFAGSFASNGDEPDVNWFGKR